MGDDAPGNLSLQPLLWTEPISEPPPKIFPLCGSRSIVAPPDGAVSRLAPQFQRGGGQYEDAGDPNQGNQSICPHAPDRSSGRTGVPSTGAQNSTGSGAVLAGAGRGIPGSGGSCCYVYSTGSGVTGAFLVGVPGAPAGRDRTPEWHTPPLCT